MSKQAQRKRNTFEDLEIPQDREAEARLLGNILEKTSIMPDVLASKLKEEEFYIISHRRIFAGMVAAYNQDPNFNILSVRDEMAKEGVLEASGGGAYLASLIDGQNWCYDFQYCIKRIKDTCRRRKVGRANSLIASLAYDSGTDWNEVVDGINKTLTIATEKPEQVGATKLVDIAQSRLAAVQEISSRGELIGIPTGFSQLDRITCGLQKGCLYVLAARPGQGKSALALNIAAHAASIGKVVAFFSLEMSKEELTDRLLCSIAKVDLHLYRSGYLGRDEWEKLGEALNEIANWSGQLIIEDTTDLTPSQLRLKALQIKKEHGLDLVVGDYLQLFKADNPKRERYQEVGQISRAKKKLAKELNVPVLELAQLNREVEKRHDRRPQMSDLREAGDIENDADVVMLIHTPPPADPNVEDVYPEVNLLVEKQRNGPLGKVGLVFLKEFTRFVSAA